MLKYLKSVKPSEWPAMLLRGGALVLIVIHLITFSFIYQHMLFIVTALVLGLLLAREMYEDLAQRFFRLKAEEYEKDLMVMQENGHAPENRSLLIEGTPSMKDITERNGRH